MRMRASPPRTSPRTRPSSRGVSSWLSSSRRSLRLPVHVSELDQFHTATNARHARADESKPRVGQTVKVEAPILILGALDHEGGIVPLDRPQLPESGVPL